MNERQDQIIAEITALKMLLRDTGLNADIEYKRQPPYWEEV